RTREILTELLRTDDCRSRPDEFRRWIYAARSAAERLEAQLRKGDSPDQAFAALKQSCADCHKSYRNARPGR
ncbi:MAG TPA: cytochrome c, partial [Planctomycetota bacterium]|nr:cytochrome c [Planctomycetota bacterium]